MSTKTVGDKAAIGQVAPVGKSASTSETSFEYRAAPTVKNPHGTFAKIFHGSERPMASVNSGNPEGFIGGGGINHQFAVELFGSDYSDKKTEPFINFHLNIADNFSKKYPNAGDEPKIEFLNSSDNAFPTPIETATVVYSNIEENNEDSDDDTHKEYVGTAIIEEFKENHRPKDQECQSSPNQYDCNNRQMVYVNPPNGKNYPKVEDFLNAIEKTSYNIVMGVHSHNLSMKQINKDYQEISLIRFTAIGCGLFMHDSLKHDTKKGEKSVCGYIKRGIERAHKEVETKTAIKVIEYTPQMEPVFGKKK